MKPNVKKKLIFIGVLLILILLAILYLLIFTKNTNEKKEIEPTVEPTIEPTIQPTVEPTPEPVVIDTTSETSINKIVNRENRLSDTYVPSDLVEVSVQNSGKQQLREEANTAITEMFEVAKNEGIDLNVASAYRSFKEQKSLWYTYEEKYGTKYANRLDAIAGASEHQLGLAVDITSGSKCRLKQCFDSTKAGKWLMENSYKYGYIMRYPDKEDITGVIYSPWHYRYIGKDEALKVYESKLTLEEYYKN